MYYDLNICRLKKFYEDVTEAWEGWKEKPVDTEIRLGALGDPTNHPEFLDILEKVKPRQYITSGRILGTPRDPRQKAFLEATLKFGTEVILVWSDTQHYRVALEELKKSGVKVTIGVKEEDFRKDLIKDSENYLVIPSPKSSLALDDLINVKIMEYYQSILLTDNKIIITKDITNLRPIKVYDRV